MTGAIIPAVRPAVLASHLTGAVGGELPANIVTLNGVPVTLNGQYVTLTVTP